jgi:hypothetical protein
MLSQSASVPSSASRSGPHIRRTAIRWRNPHYSRHVWLSLAYFAFGFAPITSLALALFGFVPLPVATVVLVLPAAGLAVALGVRYPDFGRLALRGYALGLLAVLVYDLSRVPGIVTGTWADFIPNIGALLLQRDDGHALLGYTWRWLGNGAGMGMAFFLAYPLVARRLPVLPAAVLFGVGVWTCLIATLVLAPQAQALLFRLSPFTMAFSLFGHLVFGGVLGVVMWRTQANVRPYASATVVAGATTTVSAAVAA